jgi:UPF0755 protein
MTRAIKWALGLGLMVIAAAAISVIGLIYLSGESPADFARAIMARWSLNGRDAELAPIDAADTRTQRFEVSSGSSAAGIGAQLAQAGLIRDAELFVAYVRAQGIADELEAGTYFLSRAQSLPKIAQALTDSRSSFIPFRVLEGWRLEQVAEAITANPQFTFDGAAFLAAASRGQGASAGFLTATGLNAGQSVEGFLFPGTYQLPPDQTPEGLVNTLTEAFIEQVGAQALNDARGQNLSPLQMVTLASIVQREAVHPDEMPRIASVYRNRLAIGMKLDADPTVQYGLADSRGGWWPQITRADYTGVISPYNTYLNAGLPPTPIANPGLDAIRAVIYPENTPYLYLRADCRPDGYHDFAVTYEEHLANGC